MTNLTVRIRPGEVPGTVVAEGYATGFGDYDRRDLRHEGWIERIERETFLKAVTANPDAHLRINFDGWPLARTKSGSMKLSVDDAGLRVSATLLETDPDVARMLRWMAKHPNEAIFSFSYQVKDQDFTDGADLRIIHALTLRDIGIVIDDPEFLTDSPSVR